MCDNETTKASTRHSHAFGLETNAPGLLVANAPLGATTSDRCLVTLPFTIGRSSESELPLNDNKASKRHCTITKSGGGFEIEDLGSTNGTFLNGLRVIGKRDCPDGALIRIGRELLVFHANAGPMLGPAPGNRYGMGGPFHTGAIVQTLKEVANSNRHVLLTGPSGAGKELAAKALCQMYSGSDAVIPLVDYNAARFTSEDEATATIFGVDSKVFSDVDARAGLIEQAAGGVLFLDEVHNLPSRVQRALLRTIEDGQFSRIGESKKSPADVHWVLASNEPGPDYGLAHDLLARLRQASLPPLSERIADIPEIFLNSFKQSLPGSILDHEDVVALIVTDHLEAMCLDGFESSNVRGILDLTDRLVAKMMTGVAPKEAVATVFSERFGDGPVAKRHSKAPVSSIPPGDTLAAVVVTDENLSHYDVYREQITTAYHRCKGNLTATETMLKSAGIRCTRRWLGIYAKKWGLR